MLLNCGCMRSTRRNICIAKHWVTTGAYECREAILCNAHKLLATSLVYHIIVGRSFDGYRKIGLINISEMKFDCEMYV